MLVYMISMDVFVIYEYCNKYVLRGEIVNIIGGHFRQNSQAAVRIALEWSFVFSFMKFASIFETQ